MIKFMFLVLLLISFPATAQIGCQSRDVVIDWLRDSHKELVIAIGLTNDGKLVEFAASSEGKTWTFIITNPQGISCLLTAGQDWTILRAAPEAKAHKL